MRDLYVEARIAFIDRPDVRLYTRNRPRGRQVLHIEATIRQLRVHGEIDVDVFALRRHDGITAAALDARRAFTNAIRNADVWDSSLGAAVSFAEQVPARPPEWKEHATTGGFTPYRLGQGLYRP